MPQCVSRSVRVLAACSLLVAGVLAVMAFGGAQPAWAAASGVLVTSSTSGPNVAAGDVLTEGLTMSGAAFGCSSGSAQETVSGNPDSPGVGDLNMTGVTFSGCTATSSKYPMTLTATGLPYSSLTVADTSGDQVDIGATAFTAVIDAGILGNYTCTFNSSGMIGSWSNATNTITFSDQTLTKTTGAECTTVTVTISLGPVVDASVGGSPPVFVTNAPSTPTISNIPTTAYIGGGFGATVTTSGDGATSVTSSTPGVCSASGLAISYVGTGTCTLIAHVAAGTFYSAADGNPQSFDVLGFSITTSSLPIATPGVAYGPVILVTAGSGTSASPYATTFKWAKGTVVSPATALPKGLKISSAGVLSGTPSTKLASGPSSVSIKVTETVTTFNGTKKVKSKTTADATIALSIA